MEALQAYVRYLGLRPKDAQAWVKLALAYERFQRWDYARASLGRAQSLDPGDAGIAELLRSLKAAAP